MAADSFAANYGPLTRTVQQLARQGLDVPRSRLGGAPGHYPTGGPAGAIEMTAEVAGGRV